MFFYVSFLGRSVDFNMCLLEHHLKLKSPGQKILNSVSHLASATVGLRDRNVSQTNHEFSERTLTSIWGTEESYVIVWKNATEVVLPFY